MKAKLYGIAYNDDGEQWDHIGAMVMPLPKKIRTKKAATQYAEEHAADYISDKTGWNVKDFLVEVVR